MFLVKKTVTLASAVVGVRVSQNIAVAEIPLNAKRTGANVVCILPLLESTPPQAAGLADLDLLSATVETASTGDITLNFTAVATNWPGGSARLVFVCFDTGDRVP